MHPDTFLAGLRCHTGSHLQESQFSLSFPLEPCSLNNNNNNKNLAKLNTTHSAETSHLPGQSGGPRKPHAASPSLTLPTSEKENAAG